MMLPRELMKMKNRKIELFGGTPLKPDMLKGDSREITDFMRMQTDLQDPEYIFKREQKSLYGFFLLWRGIGEFFIRNPKYRYAYGTVSLSNIYDPRSIALMHRTLLGKKDTVQPVTNIEVLLQPEVEEYLDRYKSGMLLIIDLGNSKPETIRRYFAEGTEAYLNYSSIDTVSK